ncbi:hypothetical protein Tco_0762981, partial [Tanacetum coccineum]
GSLIQRDSPRGTKMLDGWSEVLKGGIWVEDKPREMTYGNRFELLGGISFKEDRVVWMEVGGGIVRVRVVSRVVLGLVMKVVLMVLSGWEVLVRWFSMGELSLEEMSMKSVRGIFFGGFLVEELVLETMMIKEWNIRKVVCMFWKHDCVERIPSHIINLTTKWDLRKFSDIGSWYAIEDCAKYDKQCSNPKSDIFDEIIAYPNAQIVGDDMVRVQVPSCMAWLDYDKHVDSLSTMDNEVGVTSLESTTQTLPSFEEYTPPVTYPKEVKKTLGTLIEVEPLNETKLEEVGLKCNHNTPFCSREVPSFFGPEPQPLLHSPSLDVIFDEKKLGSSWEVSLYDSWRTI